MKNIILAIVSVILLSSCWGTDQGEGKEYVYTVENQSGNSIKIKAFDSSNSQTASNIINLDIGEELTKTKEGDIHGYNFIPFFEGDSLVIIYNNEKKQVFTIKGEDLDNDRNPFHYEGTKITFTFTEQDYINAEDCNGSCE